MNYTTNYNLKKPVGSDVINVEDFNDNADSIDAAILAEKEAVQTWVAETLGDLSSILDSVNGVVV